jgi:hypothetical protein
MLTDDPDTPGSGNWEINVGYIEERNKLERLRSVPHVDVNYGLGERIQLKYEIGWLHADVADRYIRNLRWRTRPARRGEESQRLDQVCCSRWNLVETSDNSEWWGKSDTKFCAEGTTKGCSGYWVDCSCLSDSS